jgi:hypothetical protein
MLLVNLSMFNVLAYYYSYIPISSTSLDLLFFVLWKSSSVHSYKFPDGHYHSTVHQLWVIEPWFIWNSHKLGIGILFSSSHSCRFRNTTMVLTCCLSSATSSYAESVGNTILVMPQIAESHSTFTDPGSLQQHSATQAHQSTAWFIADSAVLLS